MTAILGVFDTRDSVPSERAVLATLARPASRPDQRLRVHAEPGVIFGVATGQSDPGFAASNCQALAMDDDYVVVADASLYYLSDLRERLGRGVSPTASASELILAGFRVFGPACVEQFEGDFAYVVWDRHARRVHCARDFTGRRPLYVAEWRGGLIVASSLDSVAAMPGFDPQVNDVAVGADAAGLLFSLDDETCMRGVRSLRAGSVSDWCAETGLRTERVWKAGPVSASTMTLDDAADHLRDLLVTAVRERMSTTAPTAVWMSGGRDSPAVFAAGMHSTRRYGNAAPLLPVSRSHPPGDSGREDEAIEEITRFWQVSPHWVDARHTPMFGTLRNRSEWSAEPFAQPFEGLTSALAKKGRALGAAIALDGYGGDFLFQVSRVYLADLVARGRVGHALRDWRAMDGARSGWRGFFDYGVQPILPRWALRGLGAAKGRRFLKDPMERVSAPWIAPAFLRQHGLSERFATLGPSAQSGQSAAERETQFYLSHQFFARVNAKMAGFALDHGVELRSPLLDRRVVEFALSRPREERNNAGDHKLLLRAAMRGLLPESALVSRRGKPGTLNSYFAMHMRAEGLPRLEEMFPASTLAQAGIIDPAELSRAVARYRAEGAAYPFAESLFCTLSAESWLRARTGAVTTSSSEKQKAVRSA